MRRHALALLGVAAVVGGMVTAVPSVASTDDTQAPRTTTLKWTDCATSNYPTLQCSSVKVPLDHAKPHGKKIKIALSRVQGTSATHQGPLLVNPGGPGGSGRTLAGFVAKSLPAKVAAQYDVIGFDPRGVGASEPALDCRPDHFAPVRPASVPKSRAIERANLSRAKAFAKACGEKYGDVLQHIDTVSSARDMDVIRQALGAKKINYFGYSYGTYLGAVYAKLFPERVRRAVLDSVVDPTGIWEQVNLKQDYAFDERHKAFAAWVAKHDATYRLGTHPALVEARWYTMQRALAKRPAGGKVGAAEVEDTFLPGGYYNGYWPYLAEAFAAYVNDRNAEPLVEAYENFASVDASGDNGYSVYAAVECRDAPWPRNWNQWRHTTWKVYSQARFMTWNNAWYNAPCAFWPTKSLTPPDVSNSALPPVLLFQATDDAATPYEGAVTLKRKLRGSSLVVEQGGGNHGISLSGSDCLDAHLAAYLTDGTVPRGDGGEADAVCAAQPDPKPLESDTAAKATGTGTGTATGNGTGTGGSTLHGLLGFRP
ncbi:alpha/beta hydrolase [Streptomyces apocyni]|uniref:alpha/beta hydrolase n=1 Tax=Streptomyces apocyni TaxID=2654677 RepID=UPI0012E9D0D3|nr:alpha/beta hydrolase [Streptomyces apocyni]